MYITPMNIVFRPLLLGPLSKKGSSGLFGMLLGLVHTIDPRPTMAG